MNRIAGVELERLPPRRSCAHRSIAADNPQTGDAGNRQSTGGLGHGHRAEHRLERRAGRRDVRPAGGRPAASSTSAPTTPGARNPAFADECGVLMAFRATDGAFLWQDLAPRVKRGPGEFLLPSTTSAPHVEGNRLYYVTAECQLRCPGQRSRRRDVDLGAGHVRTPGRLSARSLQQRRAADRRPADRLHLQRPQRGPHARSLAARPKPHRGGQALGERGLARRRGRRARAARAVVQPRGRRRGRANAGALRRRRRLAARVRRRVRSRDLAVRRQPEGRPLASAPGVFSRSPIIASPVYADGRVFIAMGETRLTATGLRCCTRSVPTARETSPTAGVSGPRARSAAWSATPIVKDGLLYVGDLGGRITAWTPPPAPSSGSTRRTRQSGAACCSPASGCTSATWTA